MTISPDEISSNAYRSLFYGHPDATYLFDLDGNFLDCNQSLVTLVGRSRDELLNMSFAPIVHPAFSEITAVAFARAASGSTMEYLSRGIRADGTEFDVDITNMPLVDDAGKVLAVLGIARQVGHLQALSDALARDTVVLSIAGRVARFAGWSIEVDSEELYWSAELFRMLGLDEAAGAPTVEQAIGMYREPYATGIRAAVDACIDTGAPIDVESVIVDAFGAERHVRTIGEAVRDGTGRVVRVQGGFFDVTDVHAEREERKRLEHALESTLNQVQDIICFLDREWRVTFANTAALQLVGVTRDEGYGRRLHELFPGVATEEVIAVYRAAMDDRVVGRTRFFLEAFGVWADLTAHPTDEGIALIFRDVTDDVAAEVEREKSADRDALQASLFELSSNAIFTYDENREITLWNRAAAQLYDCPVEDAIGRVVDEVIIDVGTPLRDFAAEELASTGRWSGQLIQRTRTGRSVIVSSRVQIITTGPAAGSVMASNTDVTQIEEERAERATIELRLQTTLNQIPTGLFFLDREWRFTFVNATCASFVGRSADSIIGTVLWDQFPGFSESDRAVSYRRSMHEGATTSMRGYSELLGRWLESISYPTADGIAVYLTDVSEEELAASAGRAADVQLRRQGTLLDAARDVILVLELDGRISYANHSARELFGSDIAATTGPAAAQRLGIDTEEFTQAFDAVLRFGEWDGSFEHAHEMLGTVITDCRWQVVAASDGTPESILAVLTDVTLEREREVLDSRARRLESLGTLAGGIAHDLNNVLTPILMASQFLQSTSPDMTAQPLLKSIELSAKRGSDMIRQVLTFARGTDGERTVIDPVLVLNELSTLVTETLPKQIELWFEIEELAPISADSTQILQVLLNLITNASDAMPDGGTLTIAARVGSSQAEIPALFDLGPRPCVIITVTDTGSGMSKETASRIFEPFFTTKELGEGTGLGLATAAAIVRGHGGTIAVDSELGAGTTFSVFLPVADSNSSAQPSDEVDELFVHGAGELVLVVDDEAPIRALVREALEANGYRTLEAANGSEAIAIAESTTEPIALMFTDMMMPVMGGAAAAAYFSEHFPSVAIVAASGLGHHSEVNATARPGIDFFVSKPFDLSTLLRAVRMAIDAQRDEN